jgi:uncharacterized protein (DUF983 family)
MTDENRNAQRTALLVVFGMMFTTVGLAIGTTLSYGVPSWIFLGLGVLLPLIAAVLAAQDTDVELEELFRFLR